MSDQNSDNNGQLIIATIASVGAVGITFLILHLIWSRRHRHRLMRQERAFTTQAVRQRELARQRVAEERAQRLEHSRIREVEAALENFDISSVKTESCCAVCLERLDESSEPLGFDTSAVAIAPCLHVLHLVCWRAWLIKDNSKACPICRLPVTSTNAAEIRTRSDMSETVQSPRSLSRVDVLSNSDSHALVTDDLAQTVASAAATGSVTEPVSTGASTTSPQTVMNDAVAVSVNEGTSTSDSLSDSPRSDSDLTVNDGQSGDDGNVVALVCSENSTGLSPDEECHDNRVERPGGRCNDTHIELGSVHSLEDQRRTNSADPP